MPNCNWLNRKFRITACINRLTEANELAAAEFSESSAEEDDDVRLFSPTFSMDSAQVVAAYYKQDVDDLGLEFLGDWTPEQLKAKLGALHIECFAAVRVCWYLPKH